MITMLEKDPEFPSIHVNSTEMQNGGDEQVSPTERHIRATTSHTTSSTNALMNILKGNLGTGILAMPVAIQNAGIVVGPIGIAAMGFLATHCMYVLVICSQSLCERTGETALDYGQVAKAAFAQGPQMLRRFSKCAQITMNTCIVASAVGGLCVYVLFIAENMKQAVDFFVKLNGSTSGADITLRQYMAMVLGVLLLFMLVRKLKHLAIFAAIANVLTIVGLALTFQYTVRDLQDVSSFPAFNSWSKLPLFFGTAIFAFEGINLVLPIENQMKYPKDFVGLNGVLVTGMTIVTCLYTAVGFYGYLRFGDDVRGSITLNLPSEPLYVSVKIMFALGIIVSYGVQFYVPVEITFQPLRKMIKSNKLLIELEYCFRTIFILTTFFLAAYVPYLELIISLVGSLSGVISIVVPPILEIVTFWPKRTKGYAILVAKDVFICLFGLVGCGVGAYLSIDAIAKNFAPHIHTTNTTTTITPDNSYTWGTISYH